MDANNTVELEKAEIVKTKQKLFIYILAIVTCLIPMAIYAIASGILGAIANTIAIVANGTLIFAIIFAFIGFFALALPASGISFLAGFGIIVTVVSWSITLICTAIFFMIFPAYQTLATIISVFSIAFPILYIAMMIFPLVVSVKNGLFSFKRNKSALVTAISVSVAYGLISELWGVVLGGTTTYNIIVIVVRLICNVRLIGTFFLILMVFKLIDVIKSNNEINE